MKVHSQSVNELQGQLEDLYEIKLAYKAGSVEDALKLAQKTKKCTIMDKAVGVPTLESSKVLQTRSMWVRSLSRTTSRRLMTEKRRILRTFKSRGTFRGVYQKIGLQRWIMRSALDLFSCLDEMEDVSSVVFVKKVYMFLSWRTDASMWKEGSQGKLNKG